MYNSLYLENFFYDHYILMHKLTILYPALTDVDITLPYTKLRNHVIYP